MTNDEIRALYLRDIDDDRGDESVLWWAALFADVRAIRAATTDAQAEEIVRTRWQCPNRDDAEMMAEIVRGWCSADERQLALFGGGK